MKQTQQSGTERQRYLTQDFLQARASYWTPIRNGIATVFIGCGDDRPPTPDSASALMAGKQETILPPDHGYASIYGATAGLAKNMLVAGAAQHGPEFIAELHGFDGAMELLVTHSANPQTLHSAEGNEQSAESFAANSTNPIGCAYAAGVGATADLLTGPSSVIRDAAQAEQTYVFGSADWFDNLIDGQRAFLKYATNQQQGQFAVDRAAYDRYRQQFGTSLDIMILAGSHASATETGVISNFSLHEVGNPTAAHQEHRDFYRLDIAVATAIVLEALAGTAYRISPELLMRAFQLDSTPVRAVLAASDQDPALHDRLDPANLRMGVRGNPFEALTELKTRYE